MLRGGASPGGAGEELSPQISACWPKLEEGLLLDFFPDAKEST
jgi:hypothetical protein